MKMTSGAAPGSVLWEPPIARCPLFTRASADWLRPVEGFCRARRDGQLTIPSVAQYHCRCTSGDYPRCELVMDS